MGRNFVRNWFLPLLGIDFVKSVNAIKSSQSSAVMMGTLMIRNGDKPSRFASDTRCHVIITPALSKLIRYYHMLFCVIWYHVLSYIVLYYLLLAGIFWYYLGLSCITLYYLVFFGIIEYYLVFLCIILYCLVLSYIIWYNLVSSCIILSYIILYHLVLSGIICILYFCSSGNFWPLRNIERSQLFCMQ